MNISRLVVLIILFALLVPLTAHACIVRYRSAAELKNEAALVVSVKIISREAQEPSQNGELYSYEVKILSVEKGTLLKNPSLKVTYYNLRAREIDGVMECPLKDGSGKEVDLKIGAEYRLFLRSTNDTEILFSEVAE